MTEPLPINPDTGIPMNEDPEVPCKRLRCAVIKSSDPSTLPADWRLCHKCLKQQRENIEPTVDV